MCFEVETGPRPMKHEKAVQAGMAAYIESFEDGEARHAVAFAAFLRAVEASEGMIMAGQVSPNPLGVLLTGESIIARWQAMADKLADELEGK